MFSFQSIKVVKVSEERYCLSLIWNNSRFRFYNGNPIASVSKPQTLPPAERAIGFEYLAVEYKIAIDKGWTPSDYWTEEKPKEIKPSRSMLEDAVQQKLSLGYSRHYNKQLKWIVSILKRELKGTVPTAKRVADILDNSHWSLATKNNFRRHYIALEKTLCLYGYKGSIKSFTSNRRCPAKLHKPFRYVQAVLTSVQGYNRALHLCCLLSYGCLLRPHREIRLLTWRDISEDFSQISLAGNQNKGKRNRIVPVGEYIKPYLKAFKSPLSTNEDNVFTGKKEPYNPDYFKTLWTRYKKKSKLIEKDQTLYSFRHTGAIQVYEKTGSLTKLQQVMGHSSLQVSLTYLRGLEVKQLDAEDMPVIFAK